MDSKIQDSGGKRPNNDLDLSISDESETDAESSNNPFASSSNSMVTIKATDSQAISQLITRDVIVVLERIPIEKLVTLTKDRKYVESFLEDELKIEDPEVSRIFSDEEKTESLSSDTDEISIEYESKPTTPQTPNLDRPIINCTRPYYFCPMCLEEDSNRAKMTEHILEEVGYKPYHCLHCDKSFRQEAFARKHFQKDHKVFPNPEAMSDAFKFTHRPDDHIETWVISYLDGLENDLSFSPENPCYICISKASQMVEEGMIDPVDAHFTSASESHIRDHIKYFAYVCSLCADSHDANQPKFSYHDSNNALDHLYENHREEINLEAERPRHDPHTILKLSNRAARLIVKDQKYEIPKLEKGIRKNIESLQRTMAPNSEYAANDMYTTRPSVKKKRGRPKAANKKATSPTKETYSTPQKKPTVSTNSKLQCADGSTASSLKSPYSTRSKGVPSPTSSVTMDCVPSTSLIMPSRMYFCIFCELTSFKDEEEYRCHLFSHLDYRPYRCKNCSENFSFHTDFEEHPSINATQCPTSFSDYHYDTQQSIEQWVEGFIGKVKKTKQIPVHQDHCCICQAQQKYPAPEKNATLFRQMRHNLLEHIDFNPLKCWICDHEGISPTHFQTHLTKQHEGLNQKLIDKLICLAEEFSENLSSSAIANPNIEMDLDNITKTGMGIDENCDELIDFILNQETTEGDMEPDLNSLDNIASPSLSADFARSPKETDRRPQKKYKCASSSCNHIFGNLKKFIKHFKANHPAEPIKSITVFE